jgi:predicted GIY-YIG superfamily endonuclease
MGGMSAYLYILRCVDGSYYTGTTRGSLGRASRNMKLALSTASPRAEDR